MSIMYDIYFSIDKTLEKYVDNVSLGASNISSITGNERIHYVGI